MITFKSFRSNEIPEEIEMSESFKLSKEHVVTVADPSANGFAKEYTAANRGDHRIGGPTDKDEAAQESFNSKYKKTVVRAGYAGSGEHRYTNNETGEQYIVHKSASGRGFYGTIHAVSKVPAA